MPTDGLSIDWSLDPLDALLRWPAEQPLLMLHSGRYDENWSRYSLMAAPQSWLIFEGDPGVGRTTWQGPDPFELQRGFVHQPFADVRRALARTQDEAGLWLGYLAYDLGRWVEPEKLSATARDDRHWPMVALAWCPGYLKYDLRDGQWSAGGSWQSGGYPDLPQLPQQKADYHAGQPQSVFSRDAYEAAVERVKAYISAGDIFQANLTQRFTADWDAAHPLGERALFAQLARVSPAWYGAHVELPDGRTLVSTSPELFAQVTSRRVVSRPIKGTRPATAAAQELRESAKDAAELAMIVDLMRNDLGRVCSYGTVQVAEPREIESHPTVHHGVATVTALLEEQKTVVDLLRAAMPGGSITGAPKIRAMQIIEELEPVRRGPYCGAIGFLRGDEASLNIAIRTLLVDHANKRVDFSVGGGIVADSVAADEYQETLDKAAAMLRALRGQG